MSNFSNETGYCVREYYANGDVTITITGDIPFNNTRKITNSELDSLEQRLATGRVIFQDGQSEIRLPIPQMQRDLLADYVENRKYQRQ